MKIEIRKYHEDNLLLIDILSDKDKLKNILIVSYSDDKKNIYLKKVVFNDISTFVEKINYDILEICENISNAYGDGSDIEKLSLAHLIYIEMKYNNRGD